MTEPQSKPTGNKRATALRAEIDKLTSGTKPPADKTTNEQVNPRDFIHQWMAEHDKKPEK